MKISTKSIFRTALSLTAVVLFGTQASAQCDPPVGPVVISDIQPTSVTGTWGASASDPNGVGYKWEVRISGAGGSGSTGLQSSGTSDNGVTNAFMTGLDFASSYTVYVAYACVDDNDPASTSAWIASAPITTDALEPPFATGATNVTDVSLRVNWNSSEGADSYELEVATDSGFSNMLPGFAPLVTSLLYADVSGLTANTEYFWRVRAVGTNSSGTTTTGNSNVASRFTLGPASSVYTWQFPGEWFPALTAGPDPTKDVIIDYDYDMNIYPSFTAKSMDINAGYTVTITDGHDIILEGRLRNFNAGTAGLVIHNQGNLVQSSIGTSSNVGGMEVKRESAPIFRLDYTIWSSPATGPDAGPAVTSQSLLDFSPNTIPTRFYNYNTSNDQFVSIPGSTLFEPGRGYLIRVDNNHVVAGGSNAAATWEGTFRGKINDGNYAVPVSTVGNGFNMLGNPYASMLSLDAFLDENAAALEGAIWLWRRRNVENPSDNGSTPAFYATYTYVGGTGTATASASSVTKPAPFIQKGQGFIVQTLSTATGTPDVFFNNYMRSVDQPNAPFFRNSTIQKDRYWLNLSSEVQTYNQMLVGYVSNGSNGVDRGDGKFFGEANVALTSWLNDEEYSIQGRAPFTASDVVPLHLRTHNAGTYTITLDSADGVFAANQDIFVKDNLTNTTHNIKLAPYTFVAEAGVTSSRFEIVYSSPLGVNTSVFEANGVIVYKQNGAIQINSGNTTMANVKVFDIRGRLIAEKNNVNASETSINAGAENQVLIIQIMSDNNVTVSKKFVN